MSTTRALARLSGYAAAWLLLIVCCWALIVPAFLVGLIAGVVYEIRKHRRGETVEQYADRELQQFAAPVFDLDEIRRLRAIAKADGAEVTR